MIWLLALVVVSAALLGYLYGCWTGLRKGHELGQLDAIRQMSSW